MSKFSDNSDHTPIVAAFGLIRPLNARSLALSVLLGSHPPELPARSLVALAELFGIAGGTMRTALSRLVAQGDATVDAGRYRLAGSLLDRQRAQDTGRRAPRADWDRTWHSVVVEPDQRDISTRREFRSAMANHRFGELRPDIWMRPANLPAPATTDRIIVTGSLHGVDPSSLVDRLWNLEAIAEQAHRLLDGLEQLRNDHDWTDSETIPPVFTSSAAVVRFLRNEPLLPPQLTPGGWPVDDLRAAYDGVETDFQRLLRSFLRSA